MRQASGTGWGCCAGKDRLKLVGQSGEAWYWAILIGQPLGQAAGQTSETGLEVGEQATQGAERTSHPLETDVNLLLLSL